MVQATPALPDCTERSTLVRSYGRLDRKRGRRKAPSKEGNNNDNDQSWSRYSARQCEIQDAVEDSGESMHNLMPEHRMQRPYHVSEGPPCAGMMYQDGAIDGLMHAHRADAASCP